jgi:hypothetical protein
MVSWGTLSSPLSFLENFSDDKINLPTFPFYSTDSDNKTILSLFSEIEKKRSRFTVPAKVPRGFISRRENVSGVQCKILHAWNYANHHENHHVSCKLDIQRVKKKQERIPKWILIEFVRRFCESFKIDEEDESFFCERVNDMRQVLFSELIEVWQYGSKERCLFCWLEISGTQRKGSNKGLFTMDVLQHLYGEVRPSTPLI